MPFVALNHRTGERVDITKLPNPRAQLKSGEMVCPLCNSSVLIKAGQRRRAHFAHRAECDSDYKSHPETIEHLLGKSMVREVLLKDSSYKGAQIEFEVPVPEIKRVIDVMAIFPNGWKVAHEIQLASITTEELQERTNDYSKAGIDTHWWLGKSANTSTNRDWCATVFGEVLYLHYGDQAESKRLL